MNAAVVVVAYTQWANIIDNAMWSDFFRLHSSSDKYCDLHTMVLFITTTSSWKTSTGNKTKNGWKEKKVKTLKFTDYLHFCSDFCFSNFHFHMESNLIISMIIKWSLSGWWARKYHAAIIVKLLSMWKWRFEKQKSEQKCK